MHLSDLPHDHQVSLLERARRCAKKQDMLHKNFIEETLVATSNADSKREEEAFASAAKKYVQSKR